MFKRLMSLWVVVCAGAVIASFFGQQRTSAHENDVTALAAGTAPGSSGP